MEDGQADIKRTVLTELLKAERLIDAEFCDITAFLLAVVIVRINAIGAPSKPGAPKDQV